MKEYLKNTLNDSNKLFSGFVMLVLAVLTIPITWKEAFENEVKYYEVDISWLPFDEIASYQVSIAMTFILFLLIVHANKLLIILSKWFEKWLGVNGNSDNQRES